MQAERCIIVKRMHKDFLKILFAILKRLRKKERKKYGNAYLMILCAF